MLDFRCCLLLMHLVPSSAILSPPCSGFYDLVFQCAFILGRRLTDARLVMLWTWFVVCVGG